VTSYTLPRTVVTVRLQLTAGDPLAGDIFLMDRVAVHEGSETVLEMLNRHDPFFPFRPAGAPVVLVAKAHTVDVAVEGAAGLADPDRVAAARVVGLAAVLTTGVTLSGRARFEAPAPYGRLLDYLNSTTDPFFALATGDVTHHLNRAHVRFVMPED
jgi:hypothetical protein